MKKMNMKTIINWLYATVIDRAKTERRPSEDREINFSLYRPVCVSYLSRTALVAILLLVLGGWNSEVWGNTASSKNSSDDVQGGKIVMGGNHATFTFESKDSHSISYAGGVTTAYQLGQLDHNSSRTFKFTWSTNSGCGIKVTNISFGTRAYSAKEEMYATFNGESKKINNVVGSNTSFSASNSNGLSNGIELTIENRCTGHSKLFGGTSYHDDVEFYLEDISITFTITPEAPGLSKTTETVNVTLPANTANPTTVGYKVFTTKDHFGSYWNYAFSSNPNNKGVMSGDNFYATEAGTYKIHAKINAENNCHTESAWSNDFTITVNRLDPTLTYDNGSVDVSVNSTTDKVTLDLNSLKTAYTGNGTISYAFTEGKNNTNGSISGNTFYATEAKTYYITATSSQTGQYNRKTADFTVKVNKRTPTFVWRTFNHIYSGAVLTNLAQAQYNGATVGGLSYTYSSDSTTAAVVDGTTVRVPTTGFTTNQDARISVTTAETDFYLEGSSYHDYLIEPKKSPVFKLNGNVIADGATATIDLLIGQTATVSFENIDNTEATFTKPNNPSYVTYAHNSSTHTGVITATAFGTTNLTFSQAGNDTIFGHTGYVTVNVKKHPVKLATTLNGITCEVEDSVTTEGAYSIVTSPVDGHPFADVTIVSDNEEVVRFVDGKWRAKKDGNATLSIRMPANAYWTGDTITAALTVRKKTPVITWHLNDNYLWGARINEVVSSTNEDIEYSVTSNNPTVADYVDGSIEVYNKSGNVTLI